MIYLIKEDERKTRERERGGEENMQIPNKEDH